MSMPALMRLLQLASQAFPIGGYSHSQGLESAVERGLVKDEQGVADWIADVLEFSMVSYEMASLHAMSVAWSAVDVPALLRLNEQFLASRETAELRSATLQMGYSMRALLDVLPGLPAVLHDVLKSIEEPSLPCVWSGTATAWSIDPLDSMSAYLWSWAENQVLVAMKSVPIGQSAAQRILLRIGADIARRIGSWAAHDSELPSNFAPGLAILSAQHETQYSRLFRS
jgi:urease accessory protein